MPYKKLLAIALLSNFIIGVLLCLIVGIVKQIEYYEIACAVGLLCSAGAMLCFFKSWKSAPNSAMVALYYVLRILLVFGSVIVFVFLPFGNALGAIIPHLPSIPVITFTMLFINNKKSNN